MNTLNHHVDLELAKRTIRAHQLLHREFHDECRRLCILVASSPARHLPRSQLAALLAAWPQDAETAKPPANVSLGTGTLPVFRKLEPVDNFLFPPRPRDA